jgi:hypothetical protein
VSGKNKGGQAPEKAQPRKHVKPWYLTATEIEHLIKYIRAIWDNFPDPMGRPHPAIVLARVKALKAYLDLISPEEMEAFYAAQWPPPVYDDMFALLLGNKFLEKRKKTSTIPRWTYASIDRIQKEIRGTLLWIILANCTEEAKLQTRLAKCHQQIETIFIPLDSALKLVARLLPSRPKLGTLKAGWRSYQRTKARPQG